MDNMICLFGHWYTKAELQYKTSCSAELTSKEKSNYETKHRKFDNKDNYGTAYNMIIQEQRWEDSYTRYLIVYDFGSVMIDLYKEPETFDGVKGTAFIWGLYVVPEYRRQGNAKRLLTNAESIAFYAEHKTVVLKIDDSAPYWLKQFYEKNGYASSAENKYTLSKNIQEYSRKNETNNRN